MVIPVDDKLKLIVSEAIAAHMGEEMRTALIQEALRYLMTQPKDNYGRSSNSPVQDAFNRAMEDQVREIAKEYVRQDTALHEKIREMIAVATQRAVADPEMMISRITGAVQDALRSR